LNSYILVISMRVLTFLHTICVCITYRTYKHLM